MAADPEERLSSADALRRAIGDFLDHRPSIELTEAARADLAAVEAATAQDDAATDSHALCARARFGFQQALALWPDNLEAAAGLRATIAAMVRKELQHGHLETAQHLLQELQPPPPELVSEVEALNAARASKAAELRDLRALAKQYDLSTGIRARKLMLRTIGAVYTVSALSVAIIEKLGWFQPTNAHLLSSGLAFLSFLVVTGWMARHELRRTRVNRAAYLIFLSLATLIVLVRIACLVSAVPMGQGLAVDLVLYAMASAAEAAVLDRRMWVGAAVFVIGAFVAWTAPAWGLLTIGMSVGVAIGVMDLILHGNAKS